MKRLNNHARNRLSAELRSEERKIRAQDAIASIIAVIAICAVALGLMWLGFWLDAPFYKP